MKRLLKVIAVLVFVLIAAFVGFYFWASSGTLTQDELATIRSYAPRSYAPTASGGEPTEADDQFTIVTYNIGFLSGMTNNRPVEVPRELYAANEESARELIGQLGADFVALQEIDIDSARSYHIDQVDLVAESSEYVSAAVAINWDKRYVPFPYWPLSVHYGRTLSGQALVSRYPIRDADRVVLQGRVDAPFYYQAFYLDRLAQVVHTEVDGRELTIINVHLEAFDMVTRQAQVETILEVYREESIRPTILIGDFNCIPPQAEVRTGFADEEVIDYVGDRTIEMLLAEPGLAEVIPAEVYEDNEGPTLTYPSDRPDRRLDYIFYSSEWLENVEWRIITEAETTSDHLPVLGRFRFREEMSDPAEPQ